jgi:hypothetical protein
MCSSKPHACDLCRNLYLYLMLSLNMCICLASDYSAGAQKNVGPAGVTIVIVRDDLIGQAR